jgi:hypothetical protein
MNDLKEPDACLATLGLGHVQDRRRLTSLQDTIRTASSARLIEMTGFSGQSEVKRNGADLAQSESGTRYRGAS